MKSITDQVITGTPFDIFLAYLIELLYPFYRKHFKPWTFGENFLALEERERFIALMKAKGYTFPKEV